jgi:hypothetical protein
MMKNDHERKSSPHVRRSFVILHPIVYNRLVTIDPQFDFPFQPSIDLHDHDRVKIFFQLWLDRRVLSKK